MPTPVERLDPWKEDGNIVLTVQDGKSSFRVHRSVLSAQSEIFKDMFDCHPPETIEEETVDLCPVVHLHDPVEDVQMMLKAMYDRSYPALWYEKMPISVVAAFLRMGDKYNIPLLLDEGKARLCCASDPTSLAATELLHSGQPIFPAIAGDPHNFQIMNLLQEVDLKVPLPLAMYHCIVTCPPEKIVDGYQVDGSFYSLSLANLRSFIRMKDIFEKHKILLSKVLRACPYCSQLGCERLLQEVWSKDKVVVPQLGIWKSEWEKLPCARCRASSRASLDSADNLTWSKLPNAFCFDSWEDAKKSCDFPSLTIRAC